MTTQEDLELFSAEVSLQVAHTTCRLAVRLASSSLPQGRNQSSLVPSILGNLSAILVGIAYDIQDTGVSRREISQNDLRRFLGRLEKVCTVGLTPSTC